MCMIIIYDHDIGRLARMSILDTEVDGSNSGSSMLFPWARHFIDSAVNWVPGGDNLVMDVQCYMLFGGIALKNHAYSFILFYWFTYIAYHFVKLQDLITVKVRFCQ